MKLLVLADDLTGALEAGGILAGLLRQRSDHLPDFALVHQVGEIAVQSGQFIIRQGGLEPHDKVVAHEPG